MQSSSAISLCNSYSASPSFTLETHSPQSPRLLYWDSLWLSAFVKATSTLAVENLFTMFTLSHAEGILTDNLLQ